MPVLRERILGSLSSHRIFLYSFFSTLALAAVIANALKNYSNFYSIAIFLSKSSRSVVVLANFTFLLALIGGHIVQKIFFGSLRANEVERLYDRLWFFITESLLAFTIFRDEFDLAFMLMFGFLLFVKSFHWLASDRIEWMDQRPYPGPPLLFHVRMTTLFLILWFTDLIMFSVAIESTLANGVGGMVLFASEYAILVASIGNTISKYMLAAYDLRRAGQRGGENAPPWENKSMWVFYIELTTDFLKLTTYLVFFTIILTFYGLPLNIIRDVWMTARSFISRLRALHRYQNATRNMDQRYPNATEAEMLAMSDRTCIICREEMVLQAPAEPGQAPASEGPNTTPKKLPCGHIFHFHCLRSWLERQQSCPTCRRTVLDVNPTPAVGAPAAAAGPNAPAPGPQQANFFGGLGAQNQNPQGANNPLGNPLGLMGRFFGPPAQPPAQPPAVQFPNLPQNMAGQPTGVVIQYHIQYQNARQGAAARATTPPTVNPQQQPAQPLQDIPQFPGFVGPGGAWQPWPANGQNQAVPEAGNAAPAAAPTTPSTPAPQETSVATTASAREAAAQAALRRLAPQRPGAQTTASGDPTPAPAAPSSSSAAPDATTASTSQRIDVPKLIPLYDFGPTGLNIPPASSGIRPGLGRTGTQTPATPQSFNMRNLSFPQQVPGAQSRVPIQQLPPTLTDEQLAVMDRVTREAIDERLRVLEGVSGAVYRCIDDLMRMRSALPTTVPVSNPAARPAATSSAPAATENGIIDTSAGTSATVAVKAPVVELEAPGAESDGVEASATAETSEAIIEEASVIVPNVATAENVS
ncbi:hypothetical protein C8J56DRAFT_778219 [Mycena floridula]|nr:hypothetical protein C8J56DRAFT_778219 [Mycena floridula]